MKNNNDVGMHCQGPARLIQVGPARPVELMNIRQMFEQMARREGEMIRELRQRTLERIAAAEPNP